MRFLAILSAITTALVVSAGPTKITVGVLPNENTPAVQKFREKLAQETGFEVQIVPQTSYQALIDSFKDGSVNFAWFSSFPFVLSESQGTKPKVLFKKRYGKRSFYYSSIVVKKDSPIKTLKDLDGKIVASADNRSTSGFLFPSLLTFESFKKKLEDFSKVDFVGTHDNAIKAVMDGKADAAAVWSDDSQGKTGAWSEALKANPGAIRSIATSPRIPNDPFCVSEEFFTKNPMIVMKVMESFYALAKSGVIKEAFKADGIEMAIAEEYDIVRDAAVKLGIKITH